MNPLPFLKELAANNDRAWFQAHKAEYDRVRAGWLDDVNRFIAECSRWEPAYGRFDASQAVYRIYRDTRFSTDKTPFKTYMSASLTPRGRKAPMAGVYISAGVAPPHECSLRRSLAARRRRATQDAPCHCRQY